MTRIILLQLPLKVLLLTLFCLGTVVHLKIYQLYNIYLLTHQEPVSAFEEKRSKEIIKRLTPNSIQFIHIFLLEILALSVLLIKIHLMTWISP